jgi:hypothetical protein
MLTVGTSSVVEDLFDRKRRRPWAGEFSRQVDADVIVRRDGSAQQEPARLGIVDPEFSASRSGRQDDLARAEPAQDDDGRGYRSFDSKHSVDIGRVISKGYVEVDFARRQRLFAEIESSIRLGSRRGNSKEAKPVPTPEDEGAGRIGIRSGGPVAMAEFLGAGQIELRRPIGVRPGWRCEHDVKRCQQQD